MKTVDGKYQYKNEFILNNYPSDAKWNKIIYMMEETDLVITGQLDYGTSINCGPTLLL